MNRRTFLVFLSLLPVVLKAKIGMAEEVGERWNALSAGEKESLRLRWRAFKKLPVEKQTALKATYVRFRGLPVLRRRRILKAHKRWRLMSQRDRQSFRFKLKNWRETNPHVRTRHRKLFRRK